MSRARRAVRAARGAIFAGVALLPCSALAQLTVVPQPSQVTLPPGRSTPTYTIRWQVSAVVPAVAPVTSAFGQFVANGTVLATNPVPLTAPGPIPITATLTERVRVPQSVVRRARELGATQILYERPFADAGMETAEPQVAIVFAGSLAGPFQVTRYELQFDDQSRMRIVQVGERFKAIANVDYSGTGVIEAVWELIPPAESRAGGAVTSARLLERETIRYLEGTGRVFLDSPLLPTQELGQHYVRLRFLVPDTAEAIPPILYVVSPRAPPGGTGLPRALETKGPPHMGEIDEETRFRWDEVEGANSYQLEIFAKPAPRTDATRPEEALAPGIDRTVLLEESGPATGDFVTGVLVPGAETELAPTPPMRARLQPGSSYFWRVRALSPEGAVLAQSPVLEFRVAPSAQLDSAGP